MAIALKGRSKTDGRSVEVDVGSGKLSKMMGPYTINWEDADDLAAGVDLFTLEPGEWVYDILVVIDEGFTGFPVVDIGDYHNDTPVGLGWTVMLTDPITTGSFNKNQSETLPSGGNSFTVNEATMIGMCANASGTLDDAAMTSTTGRARLWVMVF